MKKSLLTLFVAVAAAFSANAQNLLKNESFENWDNEKTPTYWKTAGSAGNAVLAKSEDAKTGTYSVAVSGIKSGNRRLGYNEITLKKGTYNFSVFVKSSTTSTSTIGYTAVSADNKPIGSYQYVKGEDGKTIYTTIGQEWMPLSCDFTLTEDTRLALVVMAQKGAEDYTLLVDDASLTTTDGGIVEGGTVEPAPEPEPQPEEGVIFFDQLKANADQWTIVDKQLSEGLTYVWKHDAAKGYMKGSAYVNSAKLAAEAWAISPAIQLTTDNVLTFDHVQRYTANAAEEFTLWVREEGAGDDAWSQLAITHSGGSDWTFVPAGNISLSAFNNKKVQFGFKYTSTTEAAGTWEFKNFKVAGTPNSINAIATEKGENVIFDLSGRRVKKAENGIFIVNGVKQFVK